MEARVIDERRVVLTLSVKEAEYIQELVKNPMCNPEEEPPEQKEYRRNLFYSINNLNL